MTLKSINESINNFDVIKTTRYYWSSLIHSDISNEYTVTVRNKFDTPQEISGTHTPNDEYENFVIAHMEAAAESIPTKPRDVCKVPQELLVVKKKQDNMNEKKPNKCQREET